MNLMINGRGNSVVEFYVNNGSSYELAETYDTGEDIRRVRMNDDFGTLVFSTVGNLFAICKKINETY